MTKGQGGIAFVPARGGSKGIKNKNVAPLAGKPLLQYTIEAARGSNVVDRIVVSSDSPEILRVAEALGAEPLRRPPELATDNASTDDAIAHFIECLDLSRAPHTPIILLQPTSPLRTPAHVAAAVGLWRTADALGIISVCEPDKHPAKSFTLDENGYLVGLVDKNAPFVARQMLPVAYMPNGAIYVFSVGGFAEGRCIPRTGLLPLIMDIRSSVDIDSLADLARAEQYLHESRDDKL